MWKSIANYRRGFQVYYTNIGAYTPCYSTPSITLVPASTSASMTGALITNHVFAEMFPLTSPKHSPVLPNGAKAGIAVNVALFIGIIVAIIWYRRRKIRKIAEANRATTFPPVEPAMSMVGPKSRVSSAHELASPESQTQTPRSPQSNWPINTASPPPTYEPQKGRPVSVKADKPQELPGSTFLHEHHPAFASATASTDSTSPQSPPRTPTTPARGSTSGSPVMTPSSSFAGRGGSRSPIVSPLSSPKLPR